MTGPEADDGLQHVSTGWLQVRANNRTTYATHASEGQPDSHGLLSAWEQPLYNNTPTATNPMYSGQIIFLISL